MAVLATVLSNSPKPETLNRVIVTVVTNERQTMLVYLDVQTLSCKLLVWKPASTAYIGLRVWEFPLLLGFIFVQDPVDHDQSELYPLKLSYYHD